MRSVRARLLFSALAVSPDAARTVNAVAYGAALGFQLYYLKSMVADPAKPRISAMRRAGTVTAAVERALDRRLGLPARRRPPRRAGGAPAQRADLGRSAGPEAGLRTLARIPQGSPPGRLARQARAAKAARGRRAGPRQSHHAPDRSSVAQLRARPRADGASPTQAQEHGDRALWTPGDHRVEHQLLIGLEELSGEPLPGLTELNLRPFTDPETGLLLPWDEAEGSGGADAVDRAVVEYLLDSRYGDAVLRGAGAFKSSRRR